MKMEIWNANVQKVNKEKEENARTSNVAWIKEGQPTGGQVQEEVEGGYKEAEAKGKLNFEKDQLDQSEQVGHGYKNIKKVSVQEMNIVLLFHTSIEV